MTKGKFPNGLKEAMDAAGMGPSQLARLIGGNRQDVSRWAAQERRLTPEDAAKIAPHLGTSAEVLLLLKRRRPELTREATDPAAPTDDEMGDFDPDAFLGTAGVVHGQVVFSGRIPGSSPETLSRGGLGMGQIVDSGVARIESNGIASGHAVAAEWVTPPTFLRHGLGGRPNSVIIVPVTGHSMEPRLEDGDRVIVDLSQNDWIGDAIYLIDDGSTVFQAKTIKKVTSSIPPRFLIISESDRDHPDERRFDEFRIVGRVVGRISKP